MAKLKVMSVELIAPISQKEKILAFLQRRGALEISEVTDVGAVENRSQEIAEAEDQINIIKQALDVLSAVAPVKKPLTAMLEPRRELTEAQYAAKEAALPETVEKAKEILALKRESEDIKADRIRLDTYIDTLRPWVGAGLPVRSGSTGRVTFMLGSIREEISREEILTHLAETWPAIDCVDIEIVSSDPEQTAIAVYCMDEDAPEMEQALRDIGYLPAPDCAESAPEEKVAAAETEIAEGEVRLEEIDAFLRQAAEERDALEFALDALAVRKDAFAAAQRTGQTERVFVIRGYAAKKDAARIKKEVEADFDAAMEVSEPPEDADVPVILSNNAFSAPLETITGMYSLPGKGDIDPTGVMAFFYYFFFGMMLSDAGYGLIIALATGGVLLFKRNMERRMKNSVKMYFFCGLSTVFWGAMYGSWFGDAGSVILREFFGKDINPLPPIWTDAVTDLMNVLIVCFIFGLVHLFTGVAMKAVTDLKNGNKFDAFCDSVPTFLTILGIAPIFFNLFLQENPPENYTALGSFIFNAVKTVHAGLSTVSTYLLIAGLLLVVATGGRASKSIGGKIGGGLYEVYNLIGGYLGDVLSYARLLALGLATGVIAQVMNMLGTLPKSQPLKTILFIIVFIIGHLANLAINIIGAYVHTNRLQYVEFFGKFYEGGGRAFVPFEASTKYYKLKEEHV